MRYNYIIFIIFIILIDFIFLVPNVYSNSCANPGKLTSESPYYDKDKNELGLHPDLLEASNKLIKEAKSKLNLEIKLAEGFRGVGYQDYLYSQGRSCPGNIVTNASGKDMNSYHMYGLAFDFIFVDGAYDTNKDRNGNGKDDWQEVGELGESYGLEWGGRWKSFIDLPHLQYTYGLSIADLKSGKKPPDGEGIVGGLSGDVQEDILGMDAYEHISLFNDYDIEINNIGINKKEQMNSMFIENEMGKVVGFIITFLNILSWILSILIFGYISILWLLIVLARGNNIVAEVLLEKLSFGSIKAYTGFNKLVVASIFSVILISFVISGYMPLLFALIYKLLSDFISLVFML